MAAVKLSDVPAAGADLEHYAAALFQAAGYFVERNIVQRDPTEILELDLVVTNYSPPKPTSILCEVKGGDWGYSDLFKVVGWMKYLQIDRGAFFTKKQTDATRAETIAAKFAPLGISLVEFGDFSSAAALFEAAGLGRLGPTENIALWRHSYALDQKLTRRVLSVSKSQRDRKGPAEVLRYHRLINDGIFFTETIVGRLHKLYDAYKDHPKMSLACAMEMDGMPFDPHTDATANDRLGEAMREGKHPILQASMYLEHRARLSILKAAVDFACTFPDGINPPTKDDFSWDYFLFEDLPDTFKHGLVWLRQQPSYWLYALFWQQFLWGWGGFYLDDREEAEFAWMSAASGIPVDEIPTALRAFDHFFPLPQGWFVTPGWTAARVVRMMPTYFEGIGAHHRRQTYDVQGSFAVLNCPGYTSQDLARWNNCAVSFLTDGNA